MTRIVGQATQAILLMAQANEAQSSQAANRLGTGLKVRSALDDPTAYFSANRLDTRAAALEDVMGDIARGRAALKRADAAAAGIYGLLDNIEGLAKEAVASRSAALAAQASGTASAGGAAGAGSSGSASVGLSAKIWRSPSFLSNLATAETVMATEPVFATFNATRLDYPQGANAQNGDLASFLGADAASLSDASLGSTTMHNMVFELEGYIDVPPGGTHSFDVRSDDGFALQVDGTTVIDHFGRRAYRATTGSTTLTEGRHHIRIVYYEASGWEALEVRSSITGGDFLDASVLSPTYDADPRFNDQYDGILDQIDALAQDAASGQGDDASLGDEIGVVLNERATTYEQGFDSVEAAALSLRGITAADWSAEPEKVLRAIETARERIAIHDIQRKAAHDFLDSREAFNRNVIDILGNGAADLTLADTNEESARLLAAQTRSTLISQALAGGRAEGGWLLDLSRPGFANRRA